MMAAGSNGQAVHVQTVRTTRAAAERLMGGITDRPRREIVWVTQISGDHYLCLGCSGPRPSRSASPPSLVYVNHLVAVFVDGTWTAWDRSWLDEPLDLARLGEVVTLR